MDIRSTFRNHLDIVTSYGGTQAEGLSPVLDRGLNHCDGAQENPCTGVAGVMGTLPSGRGTEPDRLPRKASMPDVRVTVP